MREVDPRSRYSRRTFLKGAASAGPAAVIAAGTGLSITEAWAEDGQALFTTKTVYGDVPGADLLDRPLTKADLDPWYDKAESRWA